MTVLRVCFTTAFVGPVLLRRNSLREATFPSNNEQLAGSYRTFGRAPFLRPGTAHTRASYAFDVTRPRAIQLRMEHFGRAPLTS